MPYFLLQEPKHLQLKLYTIMQHFGRVLDFNCYSKRRIEQLNFFLLAFQC